jgi:hypothetical protein
MVCNIWIYRDFLHRLVFQRTRDIVLETGSLSVLRWVGVDIYSVQPLRKRSSD